MARVHPLVKDVDRVVRPEQVDAIDHDDDPKIGLEQLVLQLQQHDAQRLRLRLERRSADGPAQFGGLEHVCNLETVSDVDGHDRGHSDRSYAHGSIVDSELTSGGQGSARARAT